MKVPQEINHLTFQRKQGGIIPLNLIKSKFNTLSFPQEMITKGSNGKFAKHYIPRLKPKFEILPPSRELQNNG